MKVDGSLRRSKRIREAQLTNEEQRPPQRPAIEPCFDPCSSCSPSNARGRFSVLSVLNQRALGNFLCRRGFGVRDVRLTDHFFSERQPLLIRQNEVGPWVTQYDKIFALSWLDSERIVVGTKCNRLLEVTLGSDVRRSTVREIPIPECETRRNPPPMELEHCGIHAISLSPSRTRIVTGGKLPCDAVVIESTPSGIYESLGVYTGHSDWVFGLAFVTEDIFVSGSRDKHVAIWRVNSEDDPRESRQALISRQKHEQKVRDVRFSAGTSRVGSVSSDGFFVLWDPNDMRVVRSYQLAAKACFTRVESNVVCLAMEQHAAAIGSNTHLSVLDTRANVTSFERGVAEDFGKAWGVRSLSFKDHLLTVGGGSGRVYFVDLRTNRFLPLESERGKLEDAAERRRLQQQHQGEAGDLDDEELDDEDFYDSDFDPLDGALLSDEDRKRGKVHLMTGAGYICKENDVYQDYYADVPLSQLRHACYAHEWDADGVRLAMGGGPLPSGLRGCYAGVWQS